ncbi:hypothetical protein ABE354_23945 [Brevibacillus laterosporus]|uniref:hypothetical protein n=1 Tax=Brevibacillus laterosporus TaxID=1465 RepID=UPI003D230014
MDTITHEGKLYRMVERKAKAGDKFIQIIKSDLDLSSGRVYAITGFDPGGDAEFYDNVGDYRNTYNKKYVVLEPVTETAPITLISTTPAIEKTYTIQLTEHTMGELINALRYYASDVSSGEELRDQFEAIHRS